MHNKHSVPRLGALGIAIDKAEAANASSNECRNSTDSIDSDGNPSGCAPADGGPAETLEQHGRTISKASLCSQENVQITKAVVEPRSRSATPSDESPLLSKSDAQEKSKLSNGSVQTGITTVSAQTHVTLDECIETESETDAIRTKKA